MNNEGTQAPKRKEKTDPQFTSTKVWESHFTTNMVHTYQNLLKVCKPSIPQANKGIIQSLFERIIITCNHIEYKHIAIMIV